MAKLVPKKCSQCGAPLGDDLKCKYCGTGYLKQYEPVEHRPLVDNCGTHCSGMIYLTSMY